ncbi:MAG: hypothetical protein IKP06_05740 [Elusimicrobiaceae bacterium]|nr:hypothetical protein [Elusimicrobiaceae bacterium]
MNLGKISLAAVFLLVTSVAHAQVLEEGAKAAGQFGRKLSIMCNTRSGFEVLRTVRPLGQPSSIAAVATMSPSIPYKSKRILLPASLSKKIEQVSLPGYFYNFPQQLKEYADQAQVPVEYWDVWLSDAFNPNKSFRGYFVPNFETVVELLDVPVVDGGTAQDAVFEAFAASHHGDGKGFFVLAQQKNALYPKDVFVLDLRQGGWISLQESRGTALATKYNGLRRLLREMDLTQEQILARRGVLVRVDDPANPKELEVTTDGIRWDRYSMESQTAQRLWAGWKANVYISYKEHTGRVLYGKEAGDGILFNSLDVLKEVNP